MQTTWDFIEKYYPNYHGCSEIAYNNDLQKIMDGEIEGNAESIFEEEFKGDLCAIKMSFDKHSAYILEKAVEGFILANSQS